jgi:hypothetical protein
MFFNALTALTLINAPKYELLLLIFYVHIKIKQKNFKKYALTALINALTHTKI